jgi:hypothetical protein
MITATKEAPQAAASPTREDYSRRFLELDEHLHDAVVWASLLDKVVEDMDRLPSMTRAEINTSHGALQRVSDALKRTIGQLDAVYHQRTTEARA